MSEKESEDKEVTRCNMREGKEVEKLEGRNRWVRKKIMKKKKKDQQDYWDRRKRKMP